MCYHQSENSPKGGNCTVLCARSRIKNRYSVIQLQHAHRQTQTPEFDVVFLHIEWAANGCFVQIYIGRDLWMKNMPNWKMVMRYFLKKKKTLQRFEDILSKIVICHSSEPKNSLECQYKCKRKCVCMLETVPNVCYVYKVYHIKNR